MMRLHATFIVALVVAPAPIPRPAPDSCVVTVPNGVVAGSSTPERGSYGNTLLSTIGLWPGGTIVFRPGGAGFVTPDGALGMKFGWARGIPGRLQITGRRLDGAAAPLASEIPDGYGDIGFQASYLIFPAPGCWEVTARVGVRADSTIVFITKVLKVGDGPAWRRDPSRE